MPADEKTTGPTTKRSRWIRRSFFLLLVVAIIVAGIGWFRGRKKGDGPGAVSGGAAETRPVAVTVVPATLRDVAIYLDGLGNALPLSTVLVKTQVDGRLDRVLFQEGQHVHKGEVLAQIDPRPFLVTLRQAQAVLARDTAQHQNATLNLQRYEALRVENLLAQQEVDNQRATANQFAAAIKGDEAQVDNARLQLDYARITSPIDGVTGVRLVDQGNVVRASDATGLVIITQLDPMAVLFTLPEDDVPRVAKQLAAGPIAVEAYGRDGVTKLGVGKLQLIDNQINQTTATVRLKAIFPNSDRQLWPNEFIKARLLLTTRMGVLVVPAPAIQRGPQGTLVYVVNSDGTAAIRPVEVETTQDQWAVVARGLQAGEQVVVEGQGQIKPGSKVVARPAESARPKP